MKKWLILILVMVATTAMLCSKDEILYAYLDDEKEITIPKNVTKIYDKVLSWDFDHGANLVKGAIPATLRQIDERAFMFNNADIIAIKEGVDEIWFSASLTKIGSRIMENEEGLEEINIHVSQKLKIKSHLKKHAIWGLQIGNLMMISCQLILHYGGG